MKLLVKRINNWSDGEHPDFVDLLVDDVCVLNMEGGELANATIEGFLIALDALSVDFQYEIDDTDD